MEQIMINSNLTNLTNISHMHDLRVSGRGDKVETQVNASVVDRD